MKRPSEELSKRFINGLAAMGITYDEEFKQKWRYAGGNSRSHLSYYNLCYSHLEPPAWVGNCVCEQDIMENCYVTDGTYF